MTTHKNRGAKRRNVFPLSWIRVYNAMLATPSAVFLMEDFPEDVQAVLYEMQDVGIFLDKKGPLELSKKPPKDFRQQARRYA